MEAIILGNPYDINQGSITPIEIPAYEAEQAVIQLSDGFNPYLIDTGGSGSQYWFRYPTGILNPTTITDKVIIGGTSLLNTELFRVVGKANFSSFQLGSTVSIVSILDEDDLHSDSDTALATQQSIKAYIDSQQGDSLHSGDNVSLLVNDAGYLTVEADPIFTASPAGGISSTQITHWDTSYGWGNHALAGYLTTENDPIFTASDVFAVTTADITNWNTSYGWGNHADAGYITSESDPIFVASPAYGVSSTSITHWNSAYSQAHTHNNFGLLQTIINSGDGTNVLTDDGTYKPSLNSIGGSSTQVQYNLGGHLAASADFTFDTTNSRVIANQLLASDFLYLGVDTVSLYRDVDGNMVFTDEFNTATTLSELIGGATTFISPSGYTASTATVGGIPSGTVVANLDGKSLVTILQEMMFPTPSNPVWVNPIETFTNTASTPANFNGLFVIKGSSSAMTISPTFTSGNGPGGHPYAVTNGSSTNTVNASSFTSGDTVAFTGTTYTFVVTQPFIANSAESYTLPNGTVVPSSSYTGYSAGNATSTKIYTTVDPTYYGAFTAGTSSYNTLPTFTEIGTGATKLISTEPVSLTLSITTYSGSVDTHKYILIAYPDSYGTLANILFVEGGNNDVIGSFLNTTATYTRPDSSTVTYRIYYALNSYAGESTVRTLHYTVNF
jgi:hypothetical protein